MMYVAVYGTPLLIVSLTSAFARRQSWLVHFLLWVFALPLLLLFSPLLIAMISSLVLGVDWLD